MSQRASRKSSIMGATQPVNKLHPVDLTTYDDGTDSDSSYVESQPEDLDDSWPYRFKLSDSVWIRTSGGNWQSGRVSGQPKLGQTREKDGLFYPVIFCTKLRKYFAPLNGEIKPDTPHIRKLLEEGGWL
ncbi:hypothetical protein SERLA73DRAFT_190723 [Serpula lacrymans var. lacrymans S7.3]|uniref:Uncharacterized protein n=2 Tax=Serpula lacrymans var. lacrymans TaxID=341189 RepID=F8QG89_SERL3|nr:uncharacterized protein SERLADRAFT_478832 [Serpula lacrymans var. lacrymans S7.9]EGN92704.1 hypothetical protein SERLA73DRAFT_190723 [Serpula lacrymans var. lacrymans S7.3]EGO19432.1 hypothetical protein SERLADRAFT_478832 [Serpula lacrymans var. lacrymans S7.9]